MKIREKLGTKVYRRTVLDQLNTNESDNESLTEDNLLNNLKNRTKIQNFERKDKTQPIEISSKKLDSRFNFRRCQPSNDLNQLKKAKAFYDPRFESKCGQFLVDKFEQNYSFLTDVKRTELESLKKKLKKAKNDDTKEKLRFLIQRLNNQINADMERDKVKLMNKNIKEKVVNAKKFHIDQKQSNDNFKNSNDDKKPVFVNKSILKRTRLVEKYKQLKQNGKLNKYLEKKRKKLATKDRKKISNKNIRKKIF